jgi:hypothetical protein
MNPDPPNADRTEKILQTVDQMAREFMKCHDFLASSTHRLAQLLREAESRGVLLQEAFALADVSYWLRHIDWQTTLFGTILENERRILAVYLHTRAGYGGAADARPADGTHAARVDRDDPAVLRGHRRSSDGRGGMGGVRGRPAGVRGGVC